MWWNRVTSFVAPRLQQRAPGEPVGAQPVQDRAVEAAHRGERRVGVQRVAVARQPVDERLVGRRLQRDLVIGRASAGGSFCGPDGPRSPPQPPSPRMNADERVVHSGSPESSFTSASVTTTAALPLSYIATTGPASSPAPRPGSGRCSVIACEPCTSSAGLNVPIWLIELRPGDADARAGDDRERRVHDLLHVLGVLGGERAARACRRRCRPRTAARPSRSTRSCARRRRRRRHQGSTAWFSPPVGGARRPRLPAPVISTSVKRA